MANQPPNLMTAAWEHPDKAIAPTSNSHVAWLSAEVSARTIRSETIGNTFPQVFDEWLAERFRQEHAAMLAETEASWRSHHQALHAEIMETLNRNLQMSGEIIIAEVRSQRPVTPRNDSAQMPMPEGSPIELAIDVQCSPKGSSSSCKVSTKIDSRPKRIGSANEAFQSNGCNAFIWDRIEIVFTAVIVLNVLQMLVEEQYRGADVGHSLKVKGFLKPASDSFPSAEDTFRALNILFNIIYTVDLACQLKRAGLNFYKSAWTLIDVFVVPLGWLDALRVFGDGFPIQPSMIRMFRILRVFRLVEKMKCCEKLHFLIRSVKASFTTLLWAMLVIIFTQVVAALWLHYTLADFYKDDANPEADRRAVFARFGTVTRSLVTMFEIIFANWAQPCWLLMLNVSEWYGMFFVLYRCFLGFSLLTVATSVFVAETHRIHTRDHEVAILEKYRDAGTYRSQLRKLFEEVDTSSDGEISWQELRSMLANEKMLEIVEKLDVNPEHLVNLFMILQGSDSIMEIDEETVVDVDALISGVIKVGGSSTAMDLFALSHAVDGLGAKIGVYRNVAEHATRPEPKFNLPAVDPHNAPITDTV